MAEIPKPLLARIRKRAEETYPEECCGFLVGVRSVGEDGAPALRITGDIATANVAPEPDRRREFRIDPKTLLETIKRFRDGEGEEDVVGFYHSHPDHEAGLSPTDMEFARNWPRTLWLVVPVRGTGTAARGRTGAGAGAGAPAGAGAARAWWLPPRQDRQKWDPIEMTIRSPEVPPGAADRTPTPREEREGDRA